jgi:hypothetical protein
MQSSTKATFSSSLSTEFRSNKRRTRLTTVIMNTSGSNKPASKSPSLLTKETTEAVTVTIPNYNNKASPGPYDSDGGGGGGGGSGGGGGGMPAKTPLPRHKVYPALLLLFSEAISGSVLFPFVPFMVAGFGVADTPTHIGYYAGVLASAFFFCQFLSSYAWGMASDRFGRRR